MGTYSTSTRFLATIATLSVGVAIGLAPAQTTQPAGGATTPRTNEIAPAIPVADQLQLLEPLPSSGTVPPIVQWDPLHLRELAQRAHVRGYEKQLKILRRRHFGHRRGKLRERGLEELREFTDPAAFPTMIKVFANADDDVRLAMLDLFGGHEEDGQAALAYVAINDHDQAIRHEASKRLSIPATDSVLHELDVALRSADHAMASHAATLASTLGAVETIPLLIFAQAAGGPAANPPGDLAWIAIETQRAFVQGLVPVVGDASAAFQPVIGVISEGTLMRVVDAVVIVYRTQVHRSLVALSTANWDQSTSYLNYDVESWWNWYNDEYVTYKNELVMLDVLANEDGVLKP